MLLNEDYFNSISQEDITGNEDTMQTQNEICIHFSVDDGFKAKIDMVPVSRKIERLFCMLLWVYDCKVDYSQDRINEYIIDCVLKIVPDSNYPLSANDAISLINAIVRISYYTQLINDLYFTDSNNKQKHIFRYCEMGSVSRYISTVKRGETNDLGFSWQPVYNTIKNLVLCIKGEEPQPQDVFNAIQTVGYSYLNIIYTHFINKVGQRTYNGVLMFSSSCKYLTLNKDLWEKIVAGKLTHNGERVDAKIGISTDTDVMKCQVFDYYNGSFREDEAHQITKQNYADMDTHDLEMLYKEPKKKIFKHEIVIYDSVYILDRQKYYQVLMFPFLYIKKSHNNELNVYTMILYSTPQNIDWLKDNLFKEIF